jgi:hypothetical protein
LLTAVKISDKIIFAEIFFDQKIISFTHSAGCYSKKVLLKQFITPSSSTINQNNASKI